MHLTCHHLLWKLQPFKLTKKLRGRRFQALASEAGPRLLEGNRDMHDEVWASQGSGPIPDCLPVTEHVSSQGQGHFVWGVLSLELVLGILEYC